LYYHFWDTLLRPRFVDPEYQNDFAAWAYHELHDRSLAERLAILNPTDFKLMDDLCHQVIDVIEERMDEDDFIPIAEVEHPLFFMRSQVVIFDTDIRFTTPKELAAYVPQMPISSIFYHFIDSRRRTVSNENDFSEWLWNFEKPCRVLAEKINTIDPYFNNLSELRDQLSVVFAEYLEKGGSR
jgi:hypothetical protein